MLLRYRRSTRGQYPDGFHLRLALEVLHDVEEPVIHIWLVDKLYLDLIEVAQSVLCTSG